MGQTQMEEKAYQGGRPGDGRGGSGFHHCPRVSYRPIYIGAAEFADWSIVLGVMCDVTSLGCSHVQACGRRGSMIAWVKKAGC